MCGIAGSWSARPSRSDGLHLQMMADALRHRGPDDAGYWADPRAGIAIGHRRLSILDLSPEGHQPMLSAGGRFVLSFNGEVFNHQELRRELDPCLWRGRSDTEVMLAAIERWGLGAAVRRFVGMFAFALWDRDESRLFLVRDRLGIKPLYYGAQNGRFYFASELKAIRAHPEFTGEIDPDAVALLMRHNYIPAPYCIYKGLAKLPPGTILEVKGASQWGEPQAYWSAREVAERGIRHPFAGTEEEAIERLGVLLGGAVRSRMISDVPVGAFLSGGIDSSTVVALMQQHSGSPVRTFTIGFDDPDMDESQHAGRIARHLGTDHTALRVADAEVLATVPRLPMIYDEPFSDSSQIPTLLISELTRRHVTVSLSGDGGDELFAGYTRYPWTLGLWSALGRVPRPLRTAVATSLHAISPRTWTGMLSVLRPVLPRRFRVANGDRIHKFADLLAHRAPKQLYRSVLSHWDRPERLVLGSSEPGTHISDPTSLPGASFLDQMMLLDQLAYLPDDILAKVDRASMAVGLEARVPLLDHRLVEFAWSIPDPMKLRAGQGKWLLRQLLYRHVPRELVERPKMGFGVPLAQWLRRPLRPWAEALLSADRLKREGILAPQLVRSRWEEHLSGARNWHYWLWDVLMFQAWLETTHQPATGEPQVVGVA